jgi:hypothetical protein
VCGRLKFLIPKPLLLFVTLCKPRGNKSGDDPTAKGSNEELNKVSQHFLSIGHEAASSGRRTRSLLELATSLGNSTNR